MAQMAQAPFGMEAIYSFVIIVCSLMIYIVTREMYELSSYKGIKYFRQAFLFFAIAYFFRSFIKIFLPYLNLIGINRIPIPLFEFATLFVFMYFSSIAVFYLMYSLMWKRLKKIPYLVYVFHALALIIAGIIIFTNKVSVLLWINFAILIFVLIVVLVSYSKSKKKRNSMYAIYVLLFIFWALNVIDIIVPTFLQIYQLWIYLVSIGIFLLVLYKVLRKVGAD